MDQDALNQSIRRFLKMVGIRSQQEIEKAIAGSIAAGRITDKDTPFPITMTLRAEGLDLDVTFDGEISVAPREPSG
jgi:hypothetical protein